MTGPSVCLRILEAIAEREGTNPRALEPRLYDIVDPDALETLFRGVGAK